MNIKKLLLFLTLLSFIYSFDILHKCGADSITKQPFEVKAVEKNINKRKLGDEYSPLKIYVDFTYIESQTKVISSSRLDYLKEIFEELTNYLSILLSVEHSEEILLENGLIESSCEIPKYNPQLRTSIKDYDLVIFPIINDTLKETQVLAQAWACLTLTGNHRPVAGVVEINPDFSLNKLDSSYYMKYILLHEISHVLGFSYAFFKILNAVKTERKNGITRDYINTTKVVEKAREHFNCEYIQGVELENQGGIGSAASHWESRYMLGDYMISTDYPEYAISDITLAFFEDTGFYKVNYYTGGLFRYGKNQGCSFLEEDCIIEEGTNFPNEFCTEPGAFFCGSSHTNRGDCYIIKYDDILPSQFRYFQERFTGGFYTADYCPVSFNFYVKELEDISNYPYNCKFGLSLYPSIGEIIGNNSICFESSLISENITEELNEPYSICYQVECNRNNKEYYVKLGNNTITCPTKSVILKELDGFKGQIKCPDYDRVCTSEIWCNELFDCIDKKSLADKLTYDYNKSKYIQFSKIVCTFILIIINNL